MLAIRTLVAVGLILGLGTCAFAEGRVKGWAGAGAQAGIKGTKPATPKGSTPRSFSMGDTATHEVGHVRAGIGTSMPLARPSAPSSRIMQDYYPHSNVMAKPGTRGSRSAGNGLDPRMGKGNVRK